MERWLRPLFPLLFFVLVSGMLSPAQAEWVVGGEGMEETSGVDVRQHRPGSGGEAVETGPERFQGTRNPTRALDLWRLICSKQPSPRLQIPAPVPRKKRAWIMIGDVSSYQAWFIEILADLTGWFIDPEWRGIPPGELAVAWSRTIAELAKRSLVEAGYDESMISVETHATAEQLRKVLLDTGVGALVWISHGSPGAIKDSKGRAIDYGLVQSWARKALEDKGIYKIPSPANFPNPRMRQAMNRLRKSAHFGLEYLYIHACSVMADPSLAKAMLRAGGVYEGYGELKIAYVASLIPTVSNIAPLHGVPDVHALAVVPELNGKRLEEARSLLEESGLKTGTVTQDKPPSDQEKSERIYRQIPYEGTMLDKYRDTDRLAVALYLYKAYHESRPHGDGESHGHSAGDGNGEDPVAVWINRFGKNDERGRIHVGRLSAFRHPVPHYAERFAGLSSEPVKKKRIFADRTFASIKEAKEFVCKRLSNKRFIHALGHGKIAVGDLDGKTYCIEPLGCKIGQ